MIGMIAARMLGWGMGSEVFQKLTAHEGAKSQSKAPGVPRIFCPDE